MPRRALAVRATPAPLPPPVLLVPSYPTLAVIDELFREWMRHKPTRTVTTYSTGLNHWNEYLRMVGRDSSNTKADALPEDVLEYFYKWLCDSGYGRSSVQTHIASAKALWRFATAKKLVPPRFSYDAMRGGLQQAMGKYRRRTQKIDRNIVRIVPYVDSLPLPPASDRNGASLLELLRDRALVHVLYDTGGRRAEVASLSREDVEDGWSDAALIVGKGERERFIYFSAEAQAAIRAYLEARNDNLRPLWLRHDNHRGRPGLNGERWRLSLQSVWGIVKRHAAAAGVSGTTHHFRHLKATTLLERGAALEQVQDVLGHSDPGITKTIYAHTSPERLRRVVSEYSISADDLVAELDTEQERRRG